MRSLRELLADLALPPVAATVGRGYAMPAAHLLGGELPQGHLHVWSGPPGGGKTAFLLGMLLDAARRGRGVCYATYDLPDSTLARRLLAIESGVPLSALDRGDRSRETDDALAAARARLSALP